MSQRMLKQPPERGSSVLGGETVSFRRLKECGKGSEMIVVVFISQDRLGFASIIKHNLQIGGSRGSSSFSVFRDRAFKEIFRVKRDHGGWALMLWT